MGGRRRRARRGRGGGGELRRGAYTRARGGGGRRAARAAGGRAAHILLLHHGELVDAVLRHDVVRVRAREPRALEQVGDLGLRDRLAVEEVVVLLDADHAAEHHLVLLEREALVAVVEVHLDVRRDHVRAAPSWSSCFRSSCESYKLLPPPVRRRGRTGSPRRSSTCRSRWRRLRARGGAGGERRARARRARTRARGAIGNHDVVLRTEGLRLDAVAVALEALDDDAFDVHVARITRKIDPAAGRRAQAAREAGVGRRRPTARSMASSQQSVLKLLPDATAACAILRSPAQF